MRVKNNKGSITIFVLVGLLFMTSFLVILYANNLNKSKIAKEQFNIISGIYSPSESDEQSYTDAYTALRKKNAQTLTSSVENSSTIELTKTFEDKVNNYRIYGNSVTNTIEEFTVYPTKEGFLSEQGAYPTTDERFDNPTYEIIEIKKGQTLYFDYTGSDIGYVRVRCIDSDTNEVVCDLVDVEGNIAETDYYKATIYYTYTTEQTDGPDGYVTAKKDFKLGIMYLYDKPNNYNMKIYGTETVGVGDRQNIYNENLTKGYYISPTDGSLVSNSAFGYTEYYIEVEPSKQYTLSGTSGFAGLAYRSIAYYDENYDFLERVTCVATTTKSRFLGNFTTTAETKYIRVNLIYLDTDVIISPEELMIPLKKRIPKTYNDTLVKGYYISPTDGLIASNSAFGYTEYFIEVDPLEEYVLSGISGDATEAYRSVIYYDKNYNFLEGVTCVKTTSKSEFSGNFTTTAETRYIKINLIYLDTDILLEKEETEIIYLKAPLLTDDYLDFKLGKVVRSDGTEETVDLPELSTYEDYTKIEVLTEVKPSRIELEYVGYTFD